MSQHTPGPWTVAWRESVHRKGAYGKGPGSACDSSRCKPIRVEHSPGKCSWVGVDEIHVLRAGVADILAPDGDHVVCLGGHDYDDYGVIANEADAHLIAAAPELYAALKTAVDLLDSCPDTYSIPDEKEMAPLRAALSKAEGRIEPTVSPER